MDNKNFYEILEIREDASVREIRDAYKKKVKERHPDVNSCKGFRQCHKMMCDINEAYTHLIDPELRKLHDEFLAKRREEALKKAHAEYDRYMQNRLTQAEKDYLEIMNIEIKELDKNN